MNRQLGPALRDWYAALDHLDPGRVVWGFPSTVPEVVPRDRYDLGLFSAWMTELPRRQEQGLLASAQRPQSPAPGVQDEADIVRRSVGVRFRWSRNLTPLTCVERGCRRQLLVAPAFVVPLSH